MRQNKQLERQSGSNRTHAALAEWDAVSVRYPYEADPAVGPIDIRIKRGERVLLLGPSGSGKSTLLLTLSGLIPTAIPAETTGAIRIAGQDVASREPAEWADTIAHFFQDADQTLCGMYVDEEIAFALENRCLPEAEIERSIDAVLDMVGLPREWRRRRGSQLSGGEKQLVALAATLVQEADLFVADEPTAHLAPEAAARLHRLLMEGRGRTVLIVDHRLDGLVGSVERVVILGQTGKIIAEGPPAATFRANREMLEAEGIWCPLAIHLDAALSEAGISLPTPPLSIEEILDHLATLRVPRAEKARETVAAFVAARMAEQSRVRLSPRLTRLQTDEAHANPRHPGNRTPPVSRQDRYKPAKVVRPRYWRAEVIRDPVAAVAMKQLDPGSARLRRLAGMTPKAISPSENHISQRPPQGRGSDELQPGAPSPPLARLIDADCAPFLGPVVLRDINLDIRPGEVLGILGRNGAGKSTLGASLAGMLKLKRGRREGVPGAIAFQKPETQFTEGSVRDEVAASLPPQLAADEIKARTHSILANWGLVDLEARHPFELSQGQKRRLALATLTSSERWPLIVLDEPFAGLDAHWADKVATDIAALCKAGRALALVTHDMDFALRLCGRSIVVEDGGIVADGPTADLLADRELMRRAGLAEPALAPAMRWLRSC